MIDHGNRLIKPQLAEDDRPPAVLSLEEYLSSSFHPDCDFVDGRSVDRNVGSLDHSRMVATMLWLLSKMGEPANLLPLPSVRVRVAPTRVRVPDVCVVERGGPRERVISRTPLVAIEVLDEEDRFSAIMEKLADYERFGIEHIWVIDPEPRIAFRYTDAGLEEVKTGELNVPGTPIRVALSDMFAELDR